MARNKLGRPNRSGEWERRRLQAALSARLLVSRSARERGATARRANRAAKGAQRDARAVAASGT